MRRATEVIFVLTVILWLTIASGVQAEEKLSFGATAKLLATDGARDDDFGYSVALAGDTVVVGAQWDDDLGRYSGSAYVYQRDLDGPDTWGQVAKLTAADGEESDFFGISVAIDGDTVVVGAYWEGNYDFGTQPGAAYVFQRDFPGPDLWGQVAKLTAADRENLDNFGISIALSGDTVVVGAMGDDDLGSDSGSAYVFQRDVGGPDAWGQVAKLIAADGAMNDIFGISVAVDGDTAMIGAVGDDDLGSRSGSVYVFQRDIGGPDAWGQLTKLNAADGWNLDNFGISVALAGDTVVVGAEFDDDLGIDSGSAYVFQRDAGGPGAWGQVAKLNATDGTHYDIFGISVAVDGDTVVVGAPGDDFFESDTDSAYVFQRDVGGPDGWGQVAKLNAADGARDDNFGISVAVDGDAVVVGADLDDALGLGSGSAYVFEETTVEPFLTVSGLCPGEVTFAASGLTPRGRAQLYGAFAEGTDVLGEGPCIGTAISLEDAVKLWGQGIMDDTGSTSRVRTLSDRPCGAYLQIVDLTSCAVGNVVRIPSEPPVPGMP